MLPLDIFGFQALWSPYYFLIIAAITMLYLLVTGPWLSKIRFAEPVSRKQRGYFVLAMLLLYVIKGSPVDLLGHLMFSAHMTQMAVLYLAIPPLLLLGIPAWMFHSLFQIGWIAKIVRFMTRPLIAILLFNGVFSLYHIPEVFDVVKTDAMLHGGYTTMLFLFAIFMWWNIVEPLSTWSRLSHLKKIGYMFANGVLITPACALLIFAETPLFETFTNAELWAESLKLCVPAGTLSQLNLSGPELFSPFPVTEDQQLGGIIMKFLQEIIYGVVIGYIFYGWARKERETDPIDAIV